MTTINIKDRYGANEVDLEHFLSWILKEKLKSNFDEYHLFKEREKLLKEEKELKENLKHTQALLKP